MKLTIHTDGGARGNPGIAGYGFVVYDDQRNVIHQWGQFIGVKTNNEAEYEGLIAALRWSLENKEKYAASQIQINMDSQLIIRQCNGVYKIKSPHLRTLAQTVRHLVDQISLPITFTDIRRDQNALADALANQAMDRQFS